MGEKYITICSNKQEMQIERRAILYVKMERNNANIHVCGGMVYKTRITMEELQGILGNGFIKIHRSYLVSVMAIHNVTDKVYLINGEELKYVSGKKKEILAQLSESRRYIINSFHGGDVPKTREEYSNYYRSFDNMPFAFTDIEMVFNEELQVIDWIFRYGNQELAKLEKTPLDKIIGNTFGSLFDNMDSKWLISYERAAFFGERLKIVDYSPEIDTYLDIICFPTFEGHCGCILFDISKVTSVSESDDSAKALMLYMDKLLSIRHS